MTIQSLEAQLKKIEKQRNLLTKRLETRKARQFTSLPAKVGLRSVDELILSLTPYASSKLRNLAGNGTQHIRRGRKKVSAKKATRRGRASPFRQEIRDSVREALNKGEMTSAEVGRKFGVSPYTIKDWKKKWGLSKERRRRTTPKKK
jgi:hypothetical protein